MIIWKRPKLPKLNWLAQGLFLGLFAVLVNNCGPKGLDLLVCIVDAKSLGFQCSKDQGATGQFILFEQGVALECASPEDTEKFLKACKDHKVVEVTICSYSVEKKSFVCEDGTLISIEKADNYVCLSPKDRTRLLERC